MNNVYGKAGVTSVGAGIDHADAGGFTAVASNGDLDRDGERILPGCFEPLPASIPVHLDHTMRARDVIARARPYYRGDKLMIDATFTATGDAQDVRTKIRDGVLDSMSIVFRGIRWEEIDGVRTCVKGELLAADVVSVPSLPSARILSMRSLNQTVIEHARDAAADALLTLARAQVAECKSEGYATSARGLHRRHADDLLREALDPNPTTNDVRRFLRSIR